MLDIIEDMLEVGNIDDAGCVIQLCLNSDHNSYVVKTSNSRLVFYMAGYVARKFCGKMSCQSCASGLTVTREAAECNADSVFTQKI